MSVLSRYYKGGCSAATDEDAGIILLNYTEAGRLEAAVQSAIFSISQMPFDAVSRGDAAVMLLWDAYGVDAFAVTLDHSAYNSAPIPIVGERFAPHCAASKEEKQSVLIFDINDAIQLHALINEARRRVLSEPIAGRAEIRIKIEEHAFGTYAAIELVTTT